MSEQSPIRFATEEVPLYYQLGTILREKILSGHYAPGERLPTEAELVESYGVSRITVRQALKSLEKEGLIRRSAGRGTFVNEEIHGPDRLQMDGSLDDLISMGLATSVRLVDLRRVAATREDRRVFGLREGSEVVQCTRLRLYHDEPYSYIVNRMPTHIAENFTDHDWQEGSILRFFEEKLGLDLKEAEQSVRATLADSHLAELLGTRVGAPLLSVDRVVLTRSGDAVERVHTYYRGDIYSLNVHLTRDPGQSRPARSWTLKESEEGGS